MLRKIFFYPALLILCWVYAVKFNAVDYDFWARIAVGKMFFQTGGVLEHDIFSYTLTKQWFDHEWGSGVIFYFLADKFGDIGLMGLKITLMFTVMLLISRVIELQNPEPNAHRNILFYFLILLAVFFGIGHTVRCQLFTFTFFITWIYALERVRLGQTRLLWIFPVTMLIWANLHGGFVAGLGLLFIYGVGEFLNKKPYKQYFIALLSSALVTLINPYGFKYLQFIFFATTMDRSNMISEWMRTNLFNSWNEWYAFKIILAVSVITVAYYFIKNRPAYDKIDKVKFILLGVTLYLALSHIKHQSFFIISAAAFLYHDFYAIFGDKIPKNFNLVKDAVLYTFILGAGILLMVFNKILITLPVNKFPVCSVEFIRQNNIKGNLASVFHWGSYIAWKLYPNCHIAIDGRFEEVYPEDTFHLVSRLITNKHYPEIGIYWDGLLKNYHTDIIIAAKTNIKTMKTYDVLKETEGWKMIYDGPIDAVFIREELARDDYKKLDFDYMKIIRDKYRTKMDFSARGDENALL